MGFAGDLVPAWCDRRNVKYIVGIVRNGRLRAMAPEPVNGARGRFGDTGEKQRLFTAFDYAAGSWRRPRRVIAKAGHPAKGSNPRFIVTNIVGNPQQLHDRRHCVRGGMENRIKERMMLFADRVGQSMAPAAPGLGLHADAGGACADWHSRARHRCGRRAPPCA